MKLYHYVLRPNNVLKEGILSFANKKNADLSYYVRRSGKTTHEEICAWMERCFKGRSRGIRFFSEPIQWTNKSIHVLKDFIDQADLFEIDIEMMAQDGLIEAVYESPSILNRSEAMKAQVQDELLEKINGIENIDFSPIDWSMCDDALGRRFAFVRYYLLVIRGGIIQPKYLKKV